MRRNHHPLHLLFWAKRFTIVEGMNWLQDRGHISDNCVDAEQVAPVDVLRVLDLSGMPMLASDKCRRRYAQS